MTDPQPTKLEAFDERGIHFGSATLGPHGWTVIVGHHHWWRKDAHEAEQLLRSKGAKTIREEVGAK